MRERESERERDQVSYLRITQSLKGMMLILCCTFFSGDIIDRVWDLIVSVPEPCFFPILNNYTTFYNLR